MHIRVATGPGDADASRGQNDSRVMETRNTDNGWNRQEEERTGETRTQAAGCTEEGSGQEEVASVIAWAIQQGRDRQSDQSLRSRLVCINGPQELDLPYAGRPVAWPLPASTTQTKWVYMAVSPAGIRRSMVPGQISSTSETCRDVAEGQFNSLHGALSALFVILLL